MATATTAPPRTVTVTIKKVGEGWCVDAWDADLRQGGTNVVYSTNWVRGLGPTKALALAERIAALLEEELT